MLLWKKASTESKTVYLTFDDGPTPEITKAVLKMLARHNAKATFFLIGKNAEANPLLVEELKVAGHGLGNHTHNHFNGWQHKTGDYLQNVKRAEASTSTTLFRPPYGRIKRAQIKPLRKQGYSIAMWDVLSADFDETLSAEDCVKNVLKNVKNGSIVVFHDSKKAWPRLQKALPVILERLADEGYAFEVLE